MSYYILERTQLLPITLPEAWKFFSAPGNLKHITPAYMGFEVLSDSGSETMYPGQIISYYVKPLFGIKIFWMTEITHVKDQEYFIDEQRFGPYQFWHHTHFFREVPGGVEMRDLVHYRLPFSPIGKLVHTLMVKKQLKQIFDFRNQVLEALFGKFPGQPS